MQPVDFSKLLDTTYYENAVAQGVVPSRNIHQECDGLQSRSEGRDGELIQDIVRLSDGVFLFTSDYTYNGQRRHHQIINDSDWLHIQFRLKGGGRECVSRTNMIETPERSCTITRYPEGAVIERSIDVTDRSRVACLLANPRGLCEFLDTPISRLPDCVSWLMSQDQLELRSQMLPLRSTFALALNDILSCSFRGGIRRAYMRAKSLELLSLIIRALENDSASSPSVGRLSALDLHKISLSRNIIVENLERNLTLAQLARRVGLNRTKLALGFKQAYGTSVQAYWRDARLSRARELLSSSGARVTEVALGMGYSELSSFTRAFIRRFGILPRDCRSSKN